MASGPGLAPTADAANPASQTTALVNAPDPMRAYRACIHCRNRKTKCTLDLNGGRPKDCRSVYLCPSKHRECQGGKCNSANDGCERMMCPSEHKLAWLEDATISLPSQTLPESNESCSPVFGRVDALLKVHMENPCRRCQREQRECVLGESHRGGRRVRKKPKIENTPSPSISGPPPLPPIHDQDYRHDHVSAFAPQSQHGQPHQYSSPYDHRFGWQNPAHPGLDSPVTSNYSRSTGQASPSMTSYPAQAPPLSSIDPSLGPRPPARESIAIASADLQNPSDALDILARVADRADDDSAGSGQGNTPRPNHSVQTPWRTPPSPPKLSDYLYYKPVNEGLLGPERVYDLFDRFKHQYHPYFPIVPMETYDHLRIPWLSKNEPHLFSAILTVASKDSEKDHQVCYDHMQHLVSMILAGADADVEAVQALLLLSQWVSHRPQAEVAVGRGEEDRVAWMYIGTALRLGYFLGIDRTAFKGDTNEDPAKFNRKRLTWAFCYICDRSVSVRLGKGFWARGPGPLSGLQASDFPTLQPSSSHEDNWAMIFQANLELTQIFSNVHDILYSSKGHGWREMLEGRYAKHLDDFRTSIRHWNEKWENFTCSLPLKMSMRLSYDYLRLYVNAFAYQATVSRAMSISKEFQSKTAPTIDAATPDARFIYEAIDAAKSLLTRVNEFVGPETLCYMPCTYYLFIIYSAVFLYKARATTTMSEIERSDIRAMVNRIIDLLKRASTGPGDMGSRYSRLLQLLWCRPPKKSVHREKVHPQSINNLILPTSSQPNVIPSTQMYDQTSFNAIVPNTGDGNIANGSTFSWLDLGGAWTFATQNNSSTGSAGDMGDVMGEPGGSFSPYDVNMNLLNDYRLLNDDNTNLIF